jgi:hypothetical protein
MYSKIKCYFSAADFCIHVTRNTKYNENNLFVAPCRNTIFVLSPLNMLARIWNHLPENLKAIENVKLFTKIEAIVIR